MWCATTGCWVTGSTPTIGRPARTGGCRPHRPRSWRPPPICSARCWRGRSTRTSSVTVAATAGVLGNATRAGDPADWHEHPDGSRPLERTDRAPAPRPWRAAGGGRRNHRHPGLHQPALHPRLSGACRDPGHRGQERGGAGSAHAEPTVAASRHRHRDRSARHCRAAGARRRLGAALGRQPQHPGRAAGAGDP